MSRHALKAALTVYTVMNTDDIPAVWHHRIDEMAVSVFQGDSDSLSTEGQSRLWPFLRKQDCGTNCVVSPAQICLVHSPSLPCQGQVCVDQPEIDHIPECKYQAYEANNIQVKTHGVYI